MFHRYLLIIVSCLLAGILFAQADTLSLPLPQFSNPFYDSFSRNYIGTTAAGRGYTGVSFRGDIDNALLNPASVVPDSSQVFVELNIKPSLEAYGYPLYANYTSSIPIGLMGVSIPVDDKFTFGMLYNVPKSITLEDFSFFINQGADIIQRFPTYSLHQATALIALHSGPLHLGLDLHNQLHYIDDPIYLRTYERIRKSKYCLRLQPGIIYQLGPANIGFSMMPETKFNWNLKYANYDFLMPLWLTGGIGINKSDYTFAAEAEWEQTSEICDDFDDHYTLKAGFEKIKGKTTYRLGYLFSSNVYSGMIHLGQNTVNPDTINAWNSVPTAVFIEDNAQHSVTAGLSYRHKNGTLNFALMQVIMGDVKKTQINLSLSLYLSSIFRNKEYPLNE
ncbi:MAG TPA: hypothetical protein PLE33_02215 [Candidatus Cloacimonas sp.]|jgi:hypothetical protein|nr:hypothetical protein [Candidatus Cloacimonas sp.]HNX02058.1 hypothetical protein [Candidatus Cloacimonas sp.]HPS60059.1 hypothetical protein [Candidatus Cloacimonas sp.]